MSQELVSKFVAEIATAVSSRPQPGTGNIWARQANGHNFIALHTAGTAEAHAPGWVRFVFADPRYRGGKAGRYVLIDSSSQATNITSRKYKDKVGENEKREKTSFLEIAREVLERALIPIEDAVRTIKKKTLKAIKIAEDELQHLKLMHANSRKERISPEMASLKQNMLQSVASARAEESSSSKGKFWPMVTGIGIKGGLFASAIYAAVLIPEGISNTLQTMQGLEMVLSFIGTSGITWLAVSKSKKLA